MDKNKLNCKDIKLLGLLDINSRESLLNLSKKMGISSQAISKKIKHLLELNYFKFVTFIDLFSIGYNNAHVYLRLQGYERADYEDFILEVSSIKGISWIAELFGDFDLGISFFYKSQLDLAKFIEKINSVGKNKIKGREIFFIKDHIISNVSFDKESDKIFSKIELSDKYYTLNKQEIIILNKIKSNSRYSIYSLSEELNLDPKTITSYIKRLESLKIIRWYKIIPNYEKLNKMYNICLLEIMPGQKIQNLINFLEKEKNIPFISCTFDNNIIFDYISQDYQELKDYVNILKNKFEDKILNYKVFSIEKVIKNVERYE